MQVDSFIHDNHVELLYRNKLMSRRDAQRARRSFRSKGVGYVIQQFALRDCILTGLNTGRYESTAFVRQSFSHTDALPKFLRVSLMKVFDNVTGELLPEFDTQVVLEVLQYLSQFKKKDPEGQRAEDCASQVIKNLVSNHDNGKDKPSIVEHFHKVLGQDADPIFERIGVYMRQVLDVRDFDERITFPPGSNYEKLDPKYRYEWGLKHNSQGSLHDYAYDNFSPLGRELFERVAYQLDHDPFMGDAPVKHVLAIDSIHHRMRYSAQPKSYKAYRGVGVEGIVTMMMGLLFQKAFYRNLPIQLPLNDQDEVAKNLRNNFWKVGTIDLSNASDRVWHWICDAFLEGTPVGDLLNDIRVRHLEFPGEEEYENSAYLMGEGITFCVISAFFYSVAMAVADYYYGGAGKDLIRIYGDDIQTPHFAMTCRVLNALGCIVSEQKSYPPNSMFKESCEAHLVCVFSNPVNVRPRYVPSGVKVQFNPDGSTWLKPIAIIQLLDLARDVYPQSSIYSDAVCNTVEQLTKFKLPAVHWRTEDYGRPSRTSSDSFGRLVTRMKPENISDRAARRKLLYVCGSESPSGVDYSQRRNKYKIMAQANTRIQWQTKRRVLELSLFESVVDHAYKTQHPKRHTWGGIDSYKPEDAYSQYMLLMQSDDEFRERCIAKLESVNVALAKKLR